MTLATQTSAASVTGCRAGALAALEEREVLDRLLGHGRALQRLVLGLLAQAVGHEPPHHHLQHGHRHEGQHREAPRTAAARSAGSPRAGVRAARARGRRSTRAHHHHHQQRQQGRPGRRRPRPPPGRRRSGRPRRAGRRARTLAAVGEHVGVVRLAVDGQERPAPGRLRREAVGRARAAARRSENATSAVGVVDDERHRPGGRRARDARAEEHRVGIAAAQEGQVPEVVGHVDVYGALDLAVVGRAGGARGAPGAGRWPRSWAPRDTRQLSLPGSGPWRSKARAGSGRSG